MQSTDNPIGFEYHLPSSEYLRDTVMNCCSLSSAPKIFPSIHHSFAFQAHCSKLAPSRTTQLPGDFSFHSLKNMSSEKPNEHSKAPPPNLYLDRPRPPRWILIPTTTITLLLATISNMAANELNSSNPHYFHFLKGWGTIFRITALALTAGYNTRWSHAGVRVVVVLAMSLGTYEVALRLNPVRVRYYGGSGVAFKVS